MDINQTIQQNDKITLKLNAKGLYYWEIEMIGLDLDKLKGTTDKLMSKYPNNTINSIKEKNEIDTADI